MCLVRFEPSFSQVITTLIFSNKVCRPSEVLTEFNQLKIYIKLLKI